MINVRPPHRRSFLYPGEEVKPSREPKLRLQSTTTRALETGRMRLLVTASIFGMAFAMIGLRLVDLMVLNEGPTIIAKPHGIARPATARADIVDRNGVIVATNLPTVNLYADTHKVPEATEAAKKLTAILPDLKYDEVIKHLTSGQRFIYLRRNLTPAEQMAVNRLGIPGLSFEDSESRVYTQSSLFAHVVGVTDSDNHGIAGLEKNFDKQLAQGDAPLTLSLDVRIQSAVHETLVSSLGRYHAIAGSAVVMDVRNGEILGMVSLPDYDPKAVGTASTDERFNRSTLGLFEMGSAFKLFTAAMALESGSSNLNTTYDVSEPIKIGRFTIHDDHPVRERLTVPGIVVHSSNIGAAKIALDTGTDTQRNFLKKFGLLSPLELEVPELGTPQFPKGSNWRDINTMTISYGHGVSVTPVHMAASVSALVNGGTLYAPTLIKHTGSEAREGDQVISQKTSDSMRAIMRMVAVARGGTGGQADSAAQGYLLGGKTGSAEKVGIHGGYSKSSNRTVFVAAFPIDAPRYVVFVMLDEPHGTKETYNFATAGWNAAPTAGTIVSKIGPMLGVFPVGHDENFGPFTTLMAAYNGGTHDDVKAVLVKAPEAAPIMATQPVDPFGETDVDEVDDNASSGIADLIGAASGGSGASQ